MAYTVDDLFGGDSLMGDPNDLDNLLGFGNNENQSDNEAQNRGGNDSGDNDDEDSEKKKDDKKPDEKKVVRIKRPQPKLDAERLKGPRGLIHLKKSLADVKFQGKGRESEDLQRVMARLEHWSHRLFPKLQFDDFLEKLEKLGTKKVVQNFIKRLRIGLEDEDCDRVKSDTEEAIDDPDPIANESMGEFDRLLAEQVSLHDSMATHSPRTPAPNQGRTPSSALPRTQAVSSTPSTLTPEQRARIEANRLAAMERRRTRAAMREAGDATSTPAPESSGDADRDTTAGDAQMGEETTAAVVAEKDHADGGEGSASGAGKTTSTEEGTKDPKSCTSELCVSEASSSSGEVNVKENKASEPPVGKNPESSLKKAEASSSEEDTDQQKSSSGNSSPSESSGKRSSDNEQPSKKSKLDAKNPPSPEETSWGLRAFMEKSESNPNETEDQDSSKDNNNENDDNANITHPSNE